MESGCLRLAPLGVPVVPEVRITTRPCSEGGSRACGVAVCDEVVESGIGPDDCAPGPVGCGPAGVLGVIGGWDGVVLAAASRSAAVSDHATKRCMPSEPALTRSANSSS